MKVFVTGATGFIGSQVVRRLAGTGHELHCLVRPTSDTRISREAGAVLVVGDVTDKNSIRAGVEGCDSLVNLANVYSFWEPDRRLYTRVNVDGTRNVLECALEAGIDKVVHVSTAAIYGRPAVAPFIEDTPVGPERFSEYARTKYAGDLLVWDFHERRALPVVAIYPGAVLGPGDQKSTGQYIQNLLRGKMPATVFPDSALTCVDVRDVAEAIVRALEKDGSEGDKYLVGKHTLTFRELNGLIADIAGVRLPRRVMPDWLALANARLLTTLSSLTKKPPAWGMSLDMVRTMQHGFRFDGSKAERELGLTYTPVRVALEEAIASYRR